MINLAIILALLVLIVGASVGLVVGVSRFNRLTGLDHRFLGEAIFTFSWVLPEYLIATHALRTPGRYPYQDCQPFVAVGAIGGSVVANVLAVGVLNAVLPGKAGLEAFGAGRPLASSAVFLIVSCAAYVGLAIGAGKGMSAAQLVAGALVYLVFLGCLRLVAPREKQPFADGADPLFRAGRGNIVTSIAVTAASLLVLVYVSPVLVQLAVEEIGWTGGSRSTFRGVTLGSLTIVLGLVMAAPDLILLLRGPDARLGSIRLSRLFLSNAALVAFTALAGMDRGTIRDPLANHILAASALTACAGAATVVLFLSAPTRLSVRSRGLIVAAVALLGLSLSLFTPLRIVYLPP